jgi:serine/threonine-protein kinase RsbW
MNNGAQAAAGLTDEGHSLELRVPATIDEVRDLREAARSFAELHGVRRPEDVALAVGEACANVAVHAYLGRGSGLMELRCTCEPGEVWFVVRDEGSGLVPRTDSPGLGLGLPIIAQLADDFEVSDSQHTGTRVRMGFSANGHVVH